MTLWPVFLDSVVQQDGIRLFELDDVVTLPVVLIDVGRAEGWPRHLGVDTRVAPSEQAGWVVTAEGLSCLTDPKDPVDGPVRAGLEVPFMTVGPISFVTGTVRGIDLASTTTPEPGDPTRAGGSDHRWTLSETPVAPVAFRGGGDPGSDRDRGIVVHLELLTPRCRCRELRRLMDREGLRYARRHLRAVAKDLEGNTETYVCPDTGAVWLRHRWQRKRAMEHKDLKLWEPRLLTRQRLGPDRATSQPLPGFAELDVVAVGELTGSFRDVAQLCAASKPYLQRPGIELTPSDSEPGREVQTAAVKLRNGSQYLLVEHLGHPERFIDVRAQTSSPSSRLAARQFLAAAGVPDDRVLWLLEHWWD